MRTEKVVKNIYYDYLGNILTIIISFILKTAFIYALGKEYLGLNGLFSNILTMLSLAELGLGSAITYELYKPIAERNNDRIYVLMRFYRNAYRTIGGIILFLGLCIAPFLKYIVNFESKTNLNYHGIYLLFLMNTVISYFFNAYKITLFIAAQKKYVTKKIEYLLTIGQTVFQIVVLVCFKDYYLYLVIGIIRSILQNYIVARMADKEFPVLREKKNLTMSMSDKKNIYQNVFALALYKVSGVVVTSTDNIIISAFINTSILGCYSLYNYLITTVKSCIGILFDSLVSAVGDLNATEDASNKKNIFDIIFFSSFVLYGISSLGLWQISTLFIEEWAGEEYILSGVTILLMTMAFLISGLENATYIFRTACGLFNEAKFRPVASAVINLMVSLVLVRTIGIDGVFIGTIVSRIVTYLIIDPRIVFKKIFNLSSVEYYKQYIVYIIQLFAVGTICQLINQTFFEKGWLSIIGRIVVCISIFGGMVVVIYKNDFRYKYLFDKVKTIVRKYKSSLLNVWEKK